MKVIGWNLQQGGATRAELVAERLHAHDPDVVVLGEYWPDRSRPVLDALARRGWTHVQPQNAEKRPKTEGGVVILSRRALDEQPTPDSLQAYSHRYVPVTVSGSALEIRAVYGPPTKDHQVFWDGLLDALRSDVSRPLLVIGDLNTGEPGLDSPATSIQYSRSFKRLPEIGYVDLWRACHHPDARDYTYQHGAHPFRIDHAFGSAVVARAVRDCYYSGRERRSPDAAEGAQSLPDHAMLTVVIDDAKL